VYSASVIRLARTARHGRVAARAVSIARRLQDPLAELVKIDPKSIGVGQYQHDVDSTSWRARWMPWSRTASTRWEWTSTTASAPLLARLSGLSAWVAQSNFVTYRDTHGMFASRAALKGQCPRLGDKTFVQAAGFLPHHGRRQSARRLGGASRVLPAV